MSIIQFRLAVLDSSVVIKWYREGEPLRAQALILRSAYLDGDLDLAIPDLLVYEVSSFLRYRRDFSTDDVCRSIQDIYDMDIAVIAVTAHLAAQAIRLACQYDVTVYDAAFVACADHVGASLVTAGEVLFHKMNGRPSVVLIGNLPTDPMP